METDMGVLQRDSLKFTAAEKVYLSGDAARAIPAMEGYLASFPNGVRMTDAIYYLADSRSKTGDLNGAVDEFKRLVDLQKNDFTLRGLQQLSTLATAAGRHSEAADAFLRLSRMESTPAKVTAALDGYVASVVASADTVRILGLSEELQGVAEVSLPARRKMLYTSASILRARGQMAQAEELYAELAEDPLSEEGAEATYRIIEALFGRGMYEDAQNKIFAFSEVNTPHMYWMGRAFLLLGDIYAMGGDSFQARATYQSIVDGYSPADDGVISDALERIQKLQ